MKNSIIVITLAILILLLPACAQTPAAPTATTPATTDTPTPQGSLDTYTGPAGAVIYFPIQAPANAYMEALLFGVLTLDSQGCLRVGEEAGAPLVLWRQDFSLRVDGDIIEVLNDRAEVVGRVGLPVTMGGGQIPASSIPGLAESPCAGSYWALGDIQPLDQQPSMTPESIQPYLTFEGWQVYTSQDGSYAFSYPANAALTILGVTGFPTDEKPADMSFDEYVAKLQQMYPGDLCVRVNLEIGFLTIATPPNGQYGSPCGPTGIGDFDIVKSQHQILLGGVMVDAQKYEIYAKGASGQAAAFLDEFYVFDTPAGNLVTFGGDWNGKGRPYEDYRAEKEILLQIILSYQEAEPK